MKKFNLDKNNEDKMAIGFVQLIITNKSTPLLVLKGALYGTYLDNAIIRSDFSLNGMDSIFPFLL